MVFWLIAKYLAGGKARCMMNITSKTIIKTSFSEFNLNENDSHKSLTLSANGWY